MLRKIPWPWIGLYATLALFGAASYFKWYSMWGINHLAFLPSGWWVVYWFTVAAITALALLREPTPRLDRILNAIAKFIFDSGVWPMVAFVAGGIGLFWALRQPTHFLGDGYTLLAGLGRGDAFIVKWTEPGSVWLIRLMQTIWGDYTRETSRMAFQLLSVASGAVVLANLIWIVRNIAASFTVRVFGLASLMLSGSLVLWCGYVEFYPVLWACALTCISLCFRYLRTGRGLILMLLSIGLTCFVHLQALFFLPGLTYAVIQREWWQKRGYEPDPRWLAGVAIGGVIVIAAFLWLVATRIEFEAMFLPFFTGRPRSPEYAIFSVKHLADIGNQILIVVPAVLVGFGLLIDRKQISSVRTETTVVALWALGALIFLFAVDPVIGLGRDWDLMSLTILPIGLLLTVRLSVVGKIPANLITGTIVLALLVAGSFVAVNASRDPSEARFHELLRYYGTKNRSGWVIFANYFRERGDSTTAVQIQREMTSMFPEDAKLTATYRLLERGRSDRALELARELVRSDPFRGDYYQVLGNAHGKLGHLDSAEANYQIAIRLIPYSPMLKNEYGQVLLNAGRYTDAVEVFRGIRNYDRSITQVAEGLALAYYQLGHDDSALAVADTLFSADPNSPGGHLIYIIVNLRHGNTVEARRHYEAYLVSGKARSDYEGIRERYLYLTE